MTGKWSRAGAALLLAGTLCTSVVADDGPRADSFAPGISALPAGSDWVKADNALNLDQPGSWKDGVVPDATDRALFTSDITSDLTSELGSNLAWRGIVLAGNTAAWTITGANILAIGSAGIDAAGAGADLTLDVAMEVAASQDWTVAPGRAIDVRGEIDGAGDALVTKRGEGRVAVGHDGNPFAGGWTVEEGTLEFAAARATGSGAITLKTGTTLQGATGAFAPHLPGIANEVVLEGDATVRSRGGTTADIIRINGPISGPGRLTLGGYQVVLTGQNTFEGGIFMDLVNQFRFNPDSLGTGPIHTSSRQAQNLNHLFPLSSGVIGNDLVIGQTGGQNHHVVYWPNNHTVRMAGQIHGEGDIRLRENLGGTLILGGDNRGWTGTLTQLRQNNVTVQVDHPDGLGHARIDFGGGAVAGRVRLVLNAPVVHDRTIRIGQAYDDDVEIEASYPVHWVVNTDSEFRGDLIDWGGANGFNEAGLLKSGSARLTLAGNNTYSGPTTVQEGTVVVNGSQFSDMDIRRAGTLGGHGTVGLARIRRGRLALDQATDTLDFTGLLDVEQGSTLVLPVESDTVFARLRGDGLNAVRLAGRLRLEFSDATAVQVGDVFEILPDWASREDAGLDVLAIGLPEFTTIDDTMLFVDGTVRIIPLDRISADALEIVVPTGEIRSKSIVFDGPSFTVSIGTILPVISYEAYTETRYRVPFKPIDPANETTFTEWDGGRTVAKEVGFALPLFQKVYTLFSVDRSGTVYLGGAEGDGMIRNPAAGTVDTSAVRFKKEADRLVVAWGTALQVWLYSDGRIVYLYETGEVMLQSGATTQVLTDRPSAGSNKALVITPSASWLTAAPLQGSGRREVTITADATQVMPGEYSTEALVRWGDDRTSLVHIMIRVEEDQSRMEVPDPFEFGGPAGFIVGTNMTVRNSGNADLDFLLVDAGMMDAGYVAEAAPYAWRHIPSMSNTLLGEDQLGKTSISIGFPFVFFGTPYTSMQVLRDGTLKLGPGKTITPYSAGLVLDADARIRVLRGRSEVTVTWDRLAQPGGGLDQTFQAVLKRNGGIHFRYQSLGEGWTNGVIRVSDGVTTADGSLLNAFTSTTTTNITNVYTNEVTTRTIGNVTVSVTNQVLIGTETNVVTQAHATVERQALVFQPGREWIISATPLQGTLRPDEQMDIRILADARRLGTGHQESTVFRFSYGEQHVDSTIRFTTDGVAGDPVAGPAGDPLAMELARTMWGHEEPRVQTLRNPDGSMWLTWPVADDGLDRRYTVWYTTDLGRPFVPHPGGIGLVTGEFTDRLHMDETSVFYRVTVE